MKNIKSTVLLAGLIAIMTVILSTTLEYSADAIPRILGEATEIQEIAEIQLSTSPTPKLTEEIDDFVPVERVVDGDTIVVRIDDEEQTVRLIGVDTPETKHPNKPVECFGKEAAERLRDLLANDVVLLIPDSSQSDSDRYGRLLRYVYTSDDVFVNELLIKEGYAYEYTYDSNPYLFQSEFKDAQEEARINNRGLWNPDTCPSSETPN